MRRTVLAVLFASLFALAYALYDESSHNTTDAVSQGETFISEKSDGEHMMCTIGYINKAQRAFYTAAHCASDGAEAFYGSSKKPVGVAKILSEDRARVDLYDDVKLGDNTYSGDAIDEPAPGDSVCAWGQTTRRVRCDVISSVDGDGYVLSGPRSAGELGDSGGPMWTDDGFVATYSGKITEEPSGTVVNGYGYALDVSERSRS